MNKKGSGEIERIVGLVFGIFVFIMILIILASGDFFSSIMRAFGTLGPLGGLAGFFFILALLAGILKAIFDK